MITLIWTLRTKVAPTTFAYTCPWKRCTPLQFLLLQHTNQKTESKQQYKQTLMITMILTFRQKVWDTSLHTLAHANDVLHYKSYCSSTQTKNKRNKQKQRQTIMITMISTWRKSCTYEFAYICPGQICIPLQFLLLQYTHQKQNKQQ